jgi:hypothetical protein
MHSTITRPSHSERCSKLPRMWWPLSRLWWLQQLPVVPVHVLLLVGEQRWRPEYRCQIQPQHKATLVGSRFVSVLHA